MCEFFSEIDFRSQNGFIIFEKCIKMQSVEDFILVLDMYGLIYKTYYAFYRNPLLTKEGKNISCVYGVFDGIYRLIEKYHPTAILAAMDSIGATFRHEQYPEYKANREKTPEDLHEQIPVIEDILQTMKIQTLRCNGFEADDIIATIARKAYETKKKLYIFSSDKDLLQLVNDTTFMIRTDKMHNVKIFTADDIEAEWGVGAEKILDLLSLTGDSADNVKGVEGVGIKTAQKILNAYGSVDELFEKIESDTVLSKSLKEKMISGKQSFENAKSLISLKYDVPVEFSLAEQSFDFASGAEKLLHAQIPSLAKKFKLLAMESGTAKASSVKETVTEKISKENEKTEAGNASSASQQVIASLQTPLQKIAAAEKNNFVNNAKVVTLAVASEVKAVFDSKRAEKFCCVYVQPDSETAEQRIASVAFCFANDTIYIADCFRQSAENFSLEFCTEISQDVKKVFAEFFAQAKCTFIFHDAKASMKLLKQHEFLKDYSLKIFDTSIAAWVLQTTLSNYEIETIAKFIFDFPLLEFKEIIKKKKSIFEIEAETLKQYLVQNTLLIFYFYRLFSEGLKENDLEKIYTSIELKLLPILCRMEENGLYLSVNELKDFSDSIDFEIKKIESEIFELSGYAFNIGSPKQLQVVLFDERKLKPLKKIKTGFSTDDATLEALMEDDPIVPLIVAYRKLTKLQSTYAVALPKLVDAKSFIHTTFLQTGTATGRLSSKDPNLQNIPIRDELGRKIRHAFYATEGQLLLSADYSQIELVVLAHLSQDTALCDAFNTGLDVHAKTASLIFHTSLDAVTPEMRRIAKVINFGVIYGMSAFRLSNELKIPRKMASEFITHYFENYSGVAQFLEGVKSFAEKNGYVKTLTGRTRYIPEIINKNKTVKSSGERIAINTPVQGTASDIVKSAMIAVDEKIRNDKIDAKLLLQVHDELIFTCAENEIEKLKVLVKETLESVVKLAVPLRVSIEVGKSWGDFH